MPPAPQESEEDTLVCTPPPTDMAPRFANATPDAGPDPPSHFSEPPETDTLSRLISLKPFSEPAVKEPALRASNDFAAAIDPAATLPMEMSSPSSSM